MRTRLIVVLMLGVLLCSVVNGQYDVTKKDKPKNIHKLIHLDASEVEPNAQGIAKVSAKLKGAKPKQDFHVVGAGLKASESYQLFVDGVLIATQVAKEEDGEDGDDDSDATDVIKEKNGAVEFLFSSKAKVRENPDGGPLPLPEELMPVAEIVLVEIKNAAGDVVLSGEFGS